MTNLVDSLKAPPRAGVSRGLTLIEMLVALAVTLVMMAAVVNLFANMSASIRNRRAAIETGSQLRQVRNRLAMDLSGATCRGSTWQDPAENQGYIEIIEGEWTDKNPSNLTDGQTGNNELDYATSLVPSSQAFDSDSGIAADGRNLGSGAVTDGRGLGDWDDILSLTTQSEDSPFSGKIPYLNPATNAWETRFDESQLAEVIWFAEQNGVGGANGEPGMRRIYRRALLILPNIQLLPLSELVGTSNTEKLNDFNRRFDVSVRIEDGRLIGNTLSDLTKRENRFFHNNNVFNPPGNAVNQYPHAMLTLPNGTAGWLVLNNALALDIRVFDSTAPLIEIAGSTLGVGDAGFDAAFWLPATTVGQGDYVDLNYRASYGKFLSDYPAISYGAMPAANTSLFSELPTMKSQLRTPLGGVYDTWSYHYENDGIDQDGVLGFDQGANGLDDDNANGVDDRGERETAPPYDVPLRGVKVILRVYEPDARQIRESSVTHSFKQ